MGNDVCDSITAERIIEAEKAFFTSRIEAVKEREGNPEGAEVSFFGNTAACYIRTMPWGVFNSVKGFSNKDLSSLKEIVLFYKERNRKLLLDINPGHVEEQLLIKLAENGLYQQGFHSVLWSPLPAAGQQENNLPITVQTVSSKQQFSSYVKVHCAASGMAAEHEIHFYNNNAGLLYKPEWTLLVASFEGEPAAVAAMHVHNRTASLALASTLPEYRGRGLQAALIQSRLRLAVEKGCDLAAAQATYGSISHRNMERAGLRLAFTRAVWSQLN